MRRTRVDPVAGEFARYRVESQSREGLEHMVDLCLNDGAGGCTCEWNTIHTRQCHHLDLARARFDLEWVRPFLATQADGPTPEFLALVELVTQNAKDL